ncbi:60S acidic ribosomal protein P1, partial [Dimargaris verticillata]
VISTILLNLTYGMSPPNIVSKPKVPAMYWGKDSEDGQVLVVDGELLTGILDKSQFGAAAYGLVHSLYELYSPALAGKMLSILSRLFTRYSQMRGFTCRMDDLLFSAEGEQMRQDALAAIKNCGIEVAVDYVGLADKITDPHNMAPDQRREFHLRMEEVLRDDLKMRGLDAMMKNRTSGITSGVNTTCMPSGLYRKFPKNHMQAMTITGAKGSDINVLQISGLLGQQELEGRRVPLMISGKSLPSFRPFETHIRAGGYISGRFLRGIKPQEYYFHCMAGREGLIDTAVKTANSGYLQRCLIKHLEGIRVEYDHTVRDADGSLVQFYYGEDGLDVVKQKHLYQFDFVASNYNALKAKHKPKDALHALDIETAKKFAKKALKKPEKYPPVMSQLVPSRYLGSVSEKFHHGLSEYISTNPRQLLASKHGVANRKGQFGAMAHDECNKRTFQALMELQYMRSLADPGEAVGLLAAQGIGEPSTQMTLNTFHLAGFGAKNVTLGIPRLREIVMTASATPRTPSMTLDLLPEITDSTAQSFCKRVTRLSLSEVIDNVQ